MISTGSAEKGSAEEPNPFSCGLAEGPKPTPATFYIAPKKRPVTCMYCLKVDEHTTCGFPLLKRVPKNAKISEGCDVVCIVCSRIFRGSCCGQDEGHAIRKTSFGCGVSFHHWTLECPELHENAPVPRHGMPTLSDIQEQNLLPEQYNTRLVSQTERPIPFSIKGKFRFGGGSRRTVSKPAPAATSSFSNSPDFHGPTAPVSKRGGPEAAPASYTPSSKISGPGTKGMRTEGT